MTQLDRYCRLCLSQENVGAQLFDIGDGECDMPLYKKVMRCASVKIRSGDGLPSLLCQSCVERVDSMWQFREKCEHIDVSLRKFVKQNKKKLDDDLENQIKSILEEAESGDSRPRRSKKLALLDHSSPSTPPKNIKEEKAEDQEYSQDYLKVHTVLQLENDDWPSSPPSPPTPPSPTSKNNKDEDALTSTGRKKRKKYDRRRTEYACEFCGRTFPRSNHLAQHELTHTAEKPFQCSECKKSFWYKASLIGHIKQTHTGDVNYTCELCGKGFFKKTELTRHKPTHSNETPHKCPQCGMGFKITKTLKRHIRNVHTAQRSHTCHTCGKSFTQLQTLKVHLVLHSGVKPYVCSYCGKGFSQSAPLKTHIRIHTGERPYTCHACGDTFSTRSALTSHAFKHSGTLPYPCTRCTATFRLKRDLIQHEQGHDDEESRLGRSEIMRLAAERSASKEEEEHQLQLHQVPHHQPVPQLQIHEASGPGNQVQMAQSIQPGMQSQPGIGALPTHPHPIPVSHTVGRPNPPMFHRQQMNPPPPPPPPPVNPMPASVQPHLHSLLQTGPHLPPNPQARSPIHNQALVHSPPPPHIIQPLNQTHLHSQSHPSNLELHLPPSLQVHPQLNALYQNQI